MDGQSAKHNAAPIKNAIPPDHATTDEGLRDLKGRIGRDHPQAQHKPQHHANCEMSHKNGRPHIGVAMRLSRQQVSDQGKVTRQLVIETPPLEALVRKPSKGMAESAGRVMSTLWEPAVVVLHLFTVGFSSPVSLSDRR